MITDHRRESSDAVGRWRCGDIQNDHLGFPPHVDLPKSVQMNRPAGHNLFCRRNIMIICVFF